MSAFIVSDDTFDAIVSAWDFLITSNSYCSRDKWERHFTNNSKLSVQQKLRDMLVMQNLDSCNYRYHLNKDALLEFDTEGHESLQVKYQEIAEVNSWMMKREYGKILFLIACYEYQACETRDWDTCAAHNFCQDIKDLILTAVRESIPDEHKPSWGSYKRPANNSGPISLMSLVGSK